MLDKTRENARSFTETVMVKWRQWKEIDMEKEKVKEMEKEKVEIVVRA